MNKEKIILSVISWLTVIVSIAMIYNFSSQSGEESSATSDSVVDSIVEVLPNGDDITPTQKNDIKFSVRKMAHYGVYMLLGFCVINAICITFPIKRVFSYIIALPLPCLFAIFDEFFIQYKSFGRMPHWIDVLIDSIGSTTGIILYLLLTVFYSVLMKKIYEKRKS